MSFLQYKVLILILIFSIDTSTIADAFLLPNSGSRAAFFRRENGFFSTDPLPHPVNSKAMKSSRVEMQRIPGPTQTVIELSPIWMVLAAVLGADNSPLPITLEHAYTKDPATVKSFILDPFMESVVLNDIAHVALDLATLFGPSTVAVRLAVVVGRLCSMAADFLPDHAILPDEFAFQFTMLSIAWLGFVQAAFPPVMATLTSRISLRDGKAYAALFQSCGMTWKQFKTLKLCVLDWVTINPGEIVTSDETNTDGVHGEHDDRNSFVYWLYSGNAVVKCNGEPLYYMDSRTWRKDAGRGLIGESRLLCTRRESAAQKKSVADSVSKYLRTTVETTGNECATFLRINVAALKRLMESDPNLAESVSALAVQGMHSKLYARLDNEQ